MKKNIVVLGGVVLLLAGCQKSGQVKQVDVVASPEPTAAQVVESQYSADTHVVTTETFIDSAHNARNSLDWDGTYKGVLPCADCSGIAVTLTLTHDGRYMLEETYQGKQEGTFKSEGRFRWDQRGSVVTLEGQSSQNQYFVGENVLMMLDLNGQKVTGSLAEFYKLRKQ